MRAAIPMSEGSGGPVDYVNKVLSRNWEGQAGNGLGRTPQWNPAGFPHSPTPDATLKFGYASRSLIFPGSGWGASPPAARTFAIIFKHKFTQCMGIAMSCDLMLNGGSVTDFNYHGIGLGIGLGTPPAAPAVTVQYKVNGTFKSFTTPPQLVAGQWYAVAVSWDDSGAAPFNRKVQVYDYSAQALLAGTPFTQTEAAVQGASVSPAALHIAPIMTTGAGVLSFMGEVYCACAHATYWSAADFQNFFQNPMDACNGAYAPAGALTAGQMAPTEATDQKIVCSATRATGANPIAYQWHKSPTAGFVPGAGTAMPGQTGLVMTDVAPSASVPSFYMLQATRHGDGRRRQLHADARLPRDVADRRPGAEVSGHDHLLVRRLDHRELRAGDGGRQDDRRLRPEGRLDRPGQGGPLLARLVGRRERAGDRRRLRAPRRGARSRST